MTRAVKGKVAFTVAFAFFEVGEPVLDDLGCDMIDW
jgi:hypothetical protein